LTLDGPFAAALLASNGEATGARSDGAIFRQIRGVTTSDPGVGPQRFDFQGIEPGEYTLHIDRFDDGAGDLVLQGQNGPLSLPLADGTDARSVQVRITIEDGVPHIEFVPEDETEDVAEDAADEPAVVRIVETARTQQAQAVAGRRAAEAAARNNEDRGRGRDEGRRDNDERGRQDDRDEGRGEDERQDGRRAADEPDRDRDDGDRTESARDDRTAVPSVSGDLALGLDEALRDGDEDELRDRLREVTRGDRDEQRAQLGVLLALLADDDAVARLRAALAGDEGRDLRRELQSLAELLPGDDAERLRRALGDGDERAGRSSSDRGDGQDRTADATPDPDEEDGRLARELHEALSDGDEDDIRDSVQHLVRDARPDELRSRLTMLAEVTEGERPRERVAEALAGDRQTGLRRQLQRAIDAHAEEGVRERLHLLVLEERSDDRSGDRRSEEDGRDRETDSSEREDGGDRRLDDGDRRDRGDFFDWLERFLPGRGR
ncbi:MAG: hypothetical protein WD734_02720, partial [Dehalococcoidia bacterium]